jgi:ABC-type nitrate/sulfonate/bicarbonate transport system permease component
VASRVYPVLPSPSALGRASIDLLRRVALYQELGVTLYESVFGLAVATLLGVATAIAIGANRLANDIVTPIIVALYSVPKIIFLPVLLMILGTGAPPKIANAAMHAFFPVVLNSLVGMREINPLYVKTARSMLASSLHVVTKIYLPSMVLPVLAGIRLGLGLAFLGALLAELFESTAGVGHFATQLYNEGRIADMLVVIIALFLLLLVMISLIKVLERRLSRWREA